MEKPQKKIIIFYLEKQGKLIYSWAYKDLNRMWIGSAPGRVALKSGTGRVALMESHLKF